MLDANEAAFLRSIAEAGDDNAVRLVFADWLDDHGDTPRAEFIRVQCELASAKLAEERRQSLRRRERALLNAQRNSWCQAFGLPIEEVHFERGLISRMRLSQWDSGKMLDPAWTPRFATLMELDLSGLQLGDDDLAAFAERAQLSALRKLILSENRITDAGAAALARAAGLPRLDTLYLAQNPIGDDALYALPESAHFHLTNLDVGERPDGYCTSPGESEMARRKYVRTQLLPAVTGYFDTYERLQSAMLCVAQYWADEANDAVHARLIVSELFEPMLDGARWGDKESLVDPNLPTTRIKSRYGEESNSEISLWDSGASWDDNSGSIPLWAAFAPEEGSQEYRDLSESYAPAVMFYRHGGYEILPMRRPHLDGVQPEWGWEE
jgi:uncharacterized protein (TIGR02996 family)